MPRRIPTYRPPLAAPARDRHREYNRAGRDPALLLLYSTARWRRFREHVRLSRILCERCRAEGRTTVGEHVHHHVDPRIDPSLALDEANVQLLCSSCHSSHHANLRGSVDKNGRDGV